MPCSSGCTGTVDRCVVPCGGSREHHHGYGAIFRARPCHDQRGCRRVTAGRRVRRGRDLRCAADGGDLRRRRPDGTAATPHPAEDSMIAWGLIVYLGLWLILADVKPVAKAKLMGNPMLVHT